MAAQSPDFESFDFKIEGFSWDADPYQFSQHIQDSVFSAKGPEFAAWSYSYIGDMEQMLKTWDTRNKKPRLVTDSLKQVVDAYQAENALPYILDKAKDYQITMINEGHHMPQHRVFTAELLQGMYDNGYRHLGLETYFNSPKTDSTLLANQFPSLTSGYYLKEPQFGNMLRIALKIGFKIFGYESEGHENGKEREINQAKNIQTYMEKHPNEKIFIHCGFAHAAKGNYGGAWEKAMAGRFQEFTGIEPLTINQTSYSEKSDRSLESPLYQLTDVDKASVFVNKKGALLGSYRDGKSYFDIYVFHPRTKHFNRPNWLLFGNRKIYDLDLSKTNMTYPYLIFAYKEGEKIGSAIPYDIQETTDGKVKLVLEEGTTYNLILWNQDKQALKGTYRAN